MATASKTRTTARRTAAKRIPVKRAVVAKKPIAAKPSAKVKKPKLVRHSYSLTKAEYGMLQSLKDRAARAGHPTKKGELLRAGIAVLTAMPDIGLVSALAGVPSRKVPQARR